LRWSAFSEKPVVVKLHVVKTNCLSMICLCKVDRREAFLLGVTDVFRWKLSHLTELELLVTESAAFDHVTSLRVVLWRYGASEFAQVDLVEFSVPMHGTIASVGVELTFLRHAMTGLSWFWIHLFGCESS
jgi:hypothetical protein